MASNHVQLFSWHGVLGLQMNGYRFAVRYPLKNPITSFNHLEPYGA